MSCQGRVAACAWIGVLLLGACGRLGFEVLAGDAGDDRDRMPPAPADAGMQGDGATPQPAMDAAVDAAAGLDAAAGMDGGDVPPLDAGTDAAVAIDAAADAASDAADADAGSEPECPVSPITDYCAELPRLHGVPAIDGELECGLVAQTVTPVAWTATSPIPAEHSARMAAAWLPDGLYVYLDIDDASRLPPDTGFEAWCGDGVEVYVDDDAAYASAPDYDDPGTIQLIAVAPPDDTQSVSSGGARYRSAGGGGLVGPWSSTRYATFPRPGGYVFEAFIEAADLDLASWTLGEGAALGLNVSINLSASADPPPMGEMTDCNRRMGQYFLRVASVPCQGSCLPFLNVRALCTPVLRPAD